jgi:S-adenosylhomocysteine hydrolase
VSYLTDDDFQPNQMSEIFNHPLKDYCTVQERRVADVMESFAKRPDPQPMLVIDDGAYFLRYLKQCDDSNSEFSDAFRNASVVEQTTRGHRYVVDHALDIIKKYEISVVSIAKCKTKTYFEAPFIGAAVARALRNTLTEEDILRATRIGVIGYGAVGQAVVRELLRMDPKAIIDVVDIQYEARQKVSSLARPRCRGTAQLETDASYDIILGCTGYNSFHLGQRYLLSNGAILASGSSAAIEFNRTKFIELADQSEDDDIEVVNREKTIEAGIHSPITLRHDGGKTFTFLNAGFPINFDGRLECLPAQIIQATHALMYQASVQTLSQPNGGVNAIDPRDDDWTFRRSLSYLSKM